MSASLSAAPPTDPGTAPDASAGSDMGDQSPEVLVTIAKTGDGSYMVFAGDEPDSGGADMAAGPGAAPAAPQGQPADSIGAALKAAMDILQADESSAGAPGSAEDQFQSGFGGGAAMKGGM